MSLDVYGNVTRDNVVVFSNIFFQIDRMSNLEAMSYSLPPYFSYDGFVQGPLAIRQNDYIVDVQRTDVTTGQSKAYQIVNEPEAFPDGHVEFLCIRADRASITRGA